MRRITDVTFKALASAAMEDDPREAGPATMEIIDEGKRARARELDLEALLRVALLALRSGSDRDQIEAAHRIEEILK
jgi:hypothetical protein